MKNQHQHNIVIITVSALLISANLFCAQSVLKGLFFSNETLQLPPPPGIEYAEFKIIIQGAPLIGYLTDRDMTPEGNDGSFLMAQFALAPTTLDYNNESTRFILLDYTSMMKAMFKTNHIARKEQFLNPYSKILLERPDQ